MNPATTTFALMRRGLRAFAVPIAWAVILGLYVPAADAAVNHYYVAPYGNDGDSGSLARPWRMIDKANQELRPGVIDRADVKGDSTVNVLDVQSIVNFFLLG